MKNEDIHSSNHVFKGIERALYFSLICIGICFICMGDVMNRFQAKKTNLAEYFEPIHELPTIFTWIEFSEKSADLKYGLEVNISWSIGNESFLAIGLNSLNNGLKLELEEIERPDLSFPQMFRITPLNYPKGMPKD